MSADPDLILLLVALAAFLVGGVIKGALGFGLPLLAIPAMTAAHSLPMALSIAIYPVFATNIWQTWSYRAHVPGRFLWGFLLAGAVGLFTGAILLGQIRDAYLEIAVGGLVLVYLAMRNRGKARQPTPERSRRFAPVFGFAAGAVHGATGLSGLVGTPFFHSLNLARPTFILCNGAMFSLFSILHGPTLTGLGLYQASGVWIGIVALPAAFLGLWLGGHIGRRLDADRFSRVVIGILGLTAIIPIWNGLRDIVSG
jgi:uncharacterized membrane protein YfcA